MSSAGDTTGYNSPIELHSVSNSEISLNSKTSDVCEWLKELELDRYVATFKDHEVDGRFLLKHATNQILKQDLKIKSWIVRNKMLRQIEQQRNGNLQNYAPNCSPIAGSAFTPKSPRSPFPPMSPRPVISPKIQFDSRMTFREMVRYFWMEPNTWFGKAIEAFYLICNLIACVMFVVSTEFARTYLSAELFLGSIFLLDYFLHIYGSLPRRDYIFSFFGIVDLVSCLPLLLEFFVPFANLQFLRVLRVLRVARYLRNLREDGFIMGRIQFFHLQILRVMFSIFSLLFIMSGMIFMAEGPPNGHPDPVLTSWSDAWYFTVTTMTTVGYGDLTPVTRAGKWVVIIVMLTAVVVIPWQTGSLATLWTSRQNPLAKCRGCGKTGHEEDAQFCRFCGSCLFFG